MKIFISADIEGVAGVSDWNAATLNNPEYKEACSLMTGEVVAACNGAIKAGFREIYIKDAHGSGRNIIPSQLPDEAVLIRGWSGHPYSMMQEIDNTFHASILIGYHSAAGTTGNPLAHTFRDNITKIVLNDRIASEFQINSLISYLVNVPVAFISGDELICREAKIFNDNIETESVSKGIGASSICLSPVQACKKIEEGVFRALSKDLSNNLKPLPKLFKTEIKYNDPVSAYKASFYPGIKMTDDNSICFKTDDYFEFLRTLKFIL
ncbi:MAG: amino acid amidase [bacterium]|nr:amino acid amidase [bacterium]